MITISNLKVDVEKNNLEEKILKKLNIKKDELIDYKIIKQSLDARDKNQIFYVYELDAQAKDENTILKKHSDIKVSPNRKYKIPKYNGTNKKVVVVGSGPAGLFCAYLLALNNLNPIIIERGEKVEDRIKSVNDFWKTNKLNTESNVQFGEGGAGTFSDGKLNTRVNDKFNRINFVLETFTKFGASKEILYSYKPHIGTDVLASVIKNMREEIKILGGTFLYNTKLTNIDIKNNRINKIEVNNSDYIDLDNLVLAIGHSARDTFYMLSDKLKMEAKPFALGIRIIHPQNMIDRSQYGKYYKLLSPATYKLTYKSSTNRGVYSFCMCPGGYVVNASSEKGRLAINGMSYSKRDGICSNSAIVVTITPNDFGTNPLDGIEYQRKLEEQAYKLGEGNIPVQQLKDFYENKISNLENLDASIKGSYKNSNLNSLFNLDITNSIKEAIRNFGKKIDGFDNDDTIIAAIESRTSSPVRIIRDENLESNILGIYPCGEGAGYAGGITSAAVDGIKVAEKILGENI